MPIRIVSDSVRVIPSVKSFLSLDLIPTGTFTVLDNNVPIDMHYEDRGFDTTVVFFHAALGPHVKKLPVFLGRSFSRPVRANRLFVGDPSLTLDDRLRLAWYAGNFQQPLLQESLSLLFKKICGKNRMVYFGASGGGYASLYYSGIHAGSLAIPINPQTNISRYNTDFVSKWSEICWKRPYNAEDDVCLNTSITNLVAMYSTKRMNHVLYIQNSGDIHHVDEHWRPFSEHIHPGNHMEPVIHYVGEGHIPPTPDQLTEALQAAVNETDWAKLSFKFTHED